MSMPRALLHIRYGESADAYMRNQTLEEIMEATPQATQRKITLESFDLQRSLDEAKRQIEKMSQQLREATKQAHLEREARLAAEMELAELRAQMKGRSPS